MIGLPPLVRLDPAVAVEVLVDGEWWPGFASAYRGRRVSVSWRKGPGMQHVTWESAEHVRPQLTSSTVERTFGGRCHAGSMAGDR